MNAKRNRNMNSRWMVTLTVLGGFGLLAACDGMFVLLPPANNPFNPTPVPGIEPLVIDAGEDRFATEEETLTLSAEVSGGEPPYIYRWTVEVVPDDPEELLDGVIPLLADNNRPEIDTAPFDVGHYLYRIRVTDSAGRTVVDFVPIDVAETPLRVTIEEAGDDDDVPLEAFAAESFSLTAETNMPGEFTYTWVQVSGTDAELSADDERSIEVTPTDPGEIVIRVTVREEEGATAFRNTTINVAQGDAFLVRPELPDVLVQDEPATLTANISNDTIDADALSYTWEILKGTDVRLVTPDARTTEVIAGALQTFELRVTASGTINGELREDSEEFVLVALPDLQPEFIMTVSSLNEGVSGTITFRFDAQATPKTVANIVRYIDDGFYTNVLWHRVASGADGPFVAQFGGFTREDEALTAKDPTFDPVESENETTIGNDVRSIGLALIGGNDGSGTTQIFVNMADNTFLDERGFTAFGTVVEGFERIEAMFDADLDNEDTDDGTSLAEVPVDDITILSFRRAVVTPVADDADGGAFAGDEDTRGSDEGDAFN